MRKCLICSLTFLLLIVTSVADGAMLLRNNLQRAKPGDYIVTAQGKNYSLLHINAKTPSQLTIEEISIPASKVPKSNFSWKAWACQGANGATSHVVYKLNPANGYIQNFYGLKQGQWYEMTPQSNFLPTLLNLPFNLIPIEQRRHVGGGRLFSKEPRALWQPQLIVDGYSVDDVYFDAWRAIWPKDGSDLAGKTIEIYLPEESSDYPSYFPYWLQISGLIGNAKIRIVDSGTELRSFHPLPIQ